MPCSSAYSGDLFPRLEEVAIGGCVYGNVSRAELPTKVSLPICIWLPSVYAMIVVELAISVRNLWTASWSCCLWREERLRELEYLVELSSRAGGCSLNSSSLGQNGSRSVRHWNR